MAGNPIRINNYDYRLFFEKITRQGEQMKPNTSNNDEHALKMPEIIDYIHTSGLFTECNDDECMKCGCPAYASCPNCIMHKMEDVFKQGYAKAIDIIKDAIFLCTIGNSNNVDRLRLLKEIAKLSHSPPSDSLRRKLGKVVPSKDKMVDTHIPKESK